MGSCRRRGLVVLALDGSSNSSWFTFLLYANLVASSIGRSLMSTSAIAISQHLSRFGNLRPRFGVGNYVRQRTLVAVTMFLCSAALGQTRKTALPCEYSGPLLRDSAGEIVQRKSDEMKARATNKQDVNAATKQIDAKGTVLVHLIVDTDGQVFCTKTLVGPPILAKPIQEALRHWTFAPEEVNGKRIGYAGLLQFTLCNISCGDAGYSMSILK